MPFEDRTDAGRQLAQALSAYKNLPNTLIIGLPRGGVVVAFEVAQELNCPLDVVCPRKVGAPMNPELAIGAVTESGEGIYSEELIQQLGIPDSYVEQKSKEEAAEAQRRLLDYRQGLPPRNMSDKTVIVVDDGLATGATMKAAIRSIRARNPKKIIAAVPVSPSSTLTEIQELADEALSLETPLFFQAVGQFFGDFASTEDEQVAALIKRAHQK